MRTSSGRRSFPSSVVRACLVVAIFAGSPAALAGVLPPPDVGNYLLGDGRIDLDALRASGYSGSVNFDGYRVAQSPQLVASAQRVADDEHWITRFPAPDIYYIAAAVMWDGCLVAAAETRLYRWTEAGWEEIAAGINGWINALAVHDGDLIVGGQFTIAGGIAANRIARFDGEAWHALGLGMNNEVGALAVYGSQVVASGDFTVAGTGYANRIAVWNGVNWLPLGDGLNLSAHVMTEYDGRLVVGGDFTSAGPVIVNGIAAWDGATWSSLGNGMDRGVEALAVHDGLLVAGGSFDYSGAIPTGSVAVWDGSEWSALGNVDAQVSALVEMDGQLYIGGFSNIERAGMVMRWDDPAWTSLMDAGVVSYVGGLLDFNGLLLATHQTSSEVNAYVWNGQDWAALSGPGFNGDVNAMVMYDGDLIIAGDFTQGGDVPAQGIVRWDGADWYPLGTGLPDDGSSRILTMTVHDGDLIVGGRFGEIGGVTAANIARWDGSNWSALGDGLGVVDYSHDVRALVSSGGVLYAGGNFHTSGLATARSLASWNGGGWTDLAAGSYAIVEALAAYGDVLIVGGSSINGSNYIAARGSSGWSTLGAGVAGRVTCLSVYDGELIAGGDFTSAGGATASHIAAWNGASWSALAASMTGLWGGSPYVISLAVFDDRLWLGGYFANVDGISAANVACWDGASWGNLGSGTNNEVHELVALGNALAVGGEFTMAGGLQSCRLALYNDASTTAADDGTPSRTPLITQNHPNPFNPSTTIRFDLPAAGRVRLAIYDLAGRLIRILVNGDRPCGANAAVWDGRDAAGRNVGSGSYFARLEAGDGVGTVKMGLVR